MFGDCEKQRLNCCGSKVALFADESYITRDFYVCAQAKSHKPIQYRFTFSVCLQITNSAVELHKIKPRAPP